MLKSLIENGACLPVTYTHPPISSKLSLNYLHDLTHCKCYGDSWDSLVIGEKWQGKGLPMFGSETAQVGLPTWSISTTTDHFPPPQIYLFPHLVESADTEAMDTRVHIYIGSIFILN